MSNTTLWDSVCKTDPAHTKGFKRSGGFSGTAIKPFWLMRRATEFFGVCGIGWGWRELENKLVSGVWCSKVELWFIHNNQRGVIEQWGQTEMESEREVKVDGKGTGQFRKFVDEEAPKKAVTDAVTKCLSYLGFAGDVHMGMFDDSKYVEEMRHEFKEQPKGEFENPEARKLFVDNCLESIKNAVLTKDLQSIKTTNLAKWTAMKDSPNEADLNGYNTMVNAYNDRLKALKETATKLAMKPTVDSLLAGDEVPY